MGWRERNRPIDCSWTEYAYCEWLGRWVFIGRGHWHGGKVGTGNAIRSCKPVRFFKELDGEFGRPARSLRRLNKMWHGSYVAYQKTWKKFRKTRFKPKEI